MNYPDPSDLPEVAEISLLLPGWQLAILESAAEAHGLTSAQLVRRLVRDFIDRQEEQQTVDPKENVACQW
jgi:hypothetical protein